MSRYRQALLLIGSPRAANSTSESLGNYLLQCLHESGFNTTRQRIVSALKSVEGKRGLLAATDRADLVILAAPLYVDSSPKPVIEAMEFIADRRRNAPSPDKRQRFVAIVNCGFPESQHNDTSVAIYRRFAETAGFTWAGAMTMGMGEAIGGRPLDKLGWLARNVRAAMQQAADCLTREQPISPAASALMAKPMMPAWLYLRVGEGSWRRLAREHGVAKELDAHPYAITSP